MKRVREAEREKQAANTAKRNAEYVPVGASAASQGVAAGGSAPLDAAAMNVVDNARPAARSNQGN